MKYISLFSGIECASLAAKPLGWDPICFSEIEPFPSAVLAHHYPDVPNVGDMTAHDWGQYRGKCDVVIGGSPCQAFSVAGRRESLADDRGNLTLSFVEAVNAIDPAFVIWENVPGVLSTADNAFGCFLAALAGDDDALEPGPQPRHGRSTAYWSWEKDAGLHRPKWPVAGAVVGPQRSIAWRVLDAQYFGLAQRRERVFLVGCPRTGGFDPAQILFEFDGLRRDSTPRRRAQEGVAGGAAESVGSCGEWGGDSVAGAVTAKWAKGTGGPSGDECQNLVAGTLLARGGDGMRLGNSFDLQGGLQIAHTLRGEGFDASEDGTGRGTPLVAFHPTQDPISNVNVAHALACGSSNGQGNVAVAFRQNQAGEIYVDDVMGTVNTNANASGRNTPMVMAHNGPIASCKGNDHATENKADAPEVLSVLRGETGEEAHEEWRTGVADTLQEEKVLQPEVHGQGLRPAGSEAEPLLDDGALSRPEDMPQSPMRGMRKGSTGGSSSHRRKLAEQRPGKPNPSLPVMPHKGPSRENSSWLVRRLMPRETERLQGLPDDYTLLTNWNGWRYVEEGEDIEDLRERGFQLRQTKKTKRWRVNDPDGPRYKAIGNGMAVPCIGWVIMRVHQAWLKMRKGTV